MEGECGVKPVCRMAVWAGRERAMQTVNVVPRQAVHMCKPRATAPMFAEPASILARARGLCELLPDLGNLRRQLRGLHCGGRGVCSVKTCPRPFISYAEQCHNTVAPLIARGDAKHQLSYRTLQGIFTEKLPARIKFYGRDP